jgi:integrating conjugative element protein (TIGR03752 family)
LLNRFSRTSRNAIDGTRPEVQSLVAKGSDALNAALPVYTVPRNATLIGSTGMTALVGRVPIQGQVRDPMPFKVITGKENLAANGLRIPGIEGMIWSGTAIGDWTLSCVTGKLESVTFVFEDGTIQTLSSDDNQLGGSSGNSGGNSERPLGWISDTRGIPCITGERKTNAPAFLTQRIGVMALEAAGEAAAQAETTTLINDSGSATSVVSGETGQYVLGKTLSGGSEEVAQWLRERQAQSFDAVFVPAGVELAIHVDHELPIDFHSNGRKLHHETNLFEQATSTTGSGLD